MSSHFLTDKSLRLEAAMGGWALLRRRAFAEPGVEPHYSPDRTCEIEHIDLALHIDPVARSFSGEARLRLRALAGRDVSDVRLDLDEVEVASVTDGEGKALAWRHADGALTVGAVGEVVVRWTGSPRRGLYFVGPTPAAPDRQPEAWTQCQDEDAHFLFPCFDHPSVKHPWRIAITAPAGFNVVSNGRFLGEDGGTWRWAVDEPMPAYLFTAVVLRADVHGEGRFRYIVPAGTDVDEVRRAFAKTPAMVAFLSERYGPYPWPRYDQVIVHDFIFGGMENLGATTLTDATLVDARAAIDNDLDDLVVHELAHQWFGDLVTCQDWSQGWLNEGWATYSETLWLAQDRGADAASWHLWEQLGLYLSEDGSRYRRPIVSYLFRAPIDVFDRHLYEKGALVLHTLRQLLGDEAFWAGVRVYLARHRFGTAHTRHFQRAIEDASGRCLDGFFADWVYGAGHPALEVGISHGEGVLSVSVKQTQEGEGVATVFRFPLTIAWGDQRVVVRVEARERTFSLPCETAPDWVTVDPGFRLLADVKLKAPRSMLVAQLAKDPCVIARIRAARALGEDASPPAVDALCTALAGDAFWGVRAEVADVLARLGGSKETGALLAALGDDDARARRRVVAALGSLHRPEVTGALELVAEDASILVEGEILRALGRLRSPAVWARADRAFGADSWCEVLRARAVEALGHTREVAAFDRILPWTAPDRAPRVRAPACAALARLGDEVEALRTRAVERLIELADDENFRVRVAAISALGGLRDPRAMGILTRVHASSGDGRCRRLAWEAMSAIRDGRTTEEGLAGLRREVEGLVDENRKLRERVDRVESRA